MGKTVWSPIRSQDDDALSIWRRVTRHQVPDAADKYSMRITEVIKPIQSKTPEQQRVASLQQRVAAANKALKSERQRQKVQRAQAALTKARQAAVSPPARKP